MDISCPGHSCFRLRSGNVTLLTDPFPDSLGISWGHPEAHIVTVSNSHPNHSNISQVAGNPKVVQGPGEYEIRRFYIRGIPTNTAEDDFQNTAYRIYAEGITLCHLGDLAHSLPARVVTELRASDVLFLPVGGGCTLSAAGAAALVHLLEPTIVVPMHFALPGLQTDLEGAEPFLRALGAGDTVPKATLSVSRSSLPRERTVTVFQSSS